MARTFRRKNTKWKEISHVDDWFDDQGNIVFHYGPDKTKKQRYNEYHSDTKVGYGWGVPKSWLCVVQRKFRSKSKMTLIHAIRDCNEEEVMFNPFFKDAGWWYW